MKRLGTLAASVLVGIEHLSCAWADDLADRSKACAPFQGIEYMTCVDEENGDPSERSVQAAPQSSSWIMSETMPPVDYKPQIAAQTYASASSRDAPPASLAIRCRAHRTELLLSSASPWTKAPSSEIRVAFQVNDQTLIDQRWRVADGGRSLAFPGDAAALIRSMPVSGRLLIKVYTGTAPAYESKFELTGLGVVRRRFADVCGWPPS